MNDQPLQVGLIGAGGIGSVHLARYAAIETANVAAICDSNPDTARAAAEKTGCLWFTAATEMLQSVALDAVDICTPTAMHAEPALAAIHQGKHVLCEKPLAQDPIIARQLVDAAAARGVLLMTAFCHRFHPPVVFVRELIDSGEMGDIVMFRNRFAGLHEGIEKKWFSHRAMSGGGAFLDTSIHSIDLFRFLVGEPNRVQAAMTRINPAVAEVEDAAIALLSTASGQLGVVECCWSAQGGYNVVEVYGTRGVALIHYWDGQASRYKSHSSPDWQPIPETGLDRFEQEIRHFVEACSGRGALRVTGMDGLRAAEIAAEAYAASGFVAQ